MFKRRYRRRYTRSRKVYRSKRKFRRLKMRLMPWKNPSKKEVKVFDIVSESLAANYAYTTVPSDTLFMNQNKITSFLNAIQKGTDDNNRIGNKIFVKKIVMTIEAHSCFGDGALPVGDFWLRPIVWASENNYTANTSVNGFWRQPRSDNFTNYPDRSFINVYYDKYWHVRGAQASGLVANNFSSSLGAMTVRKIYIPFNRMVEYYSTAGSEQVYNTVKNGRDNLNLAIVASWPSSGTSVYNTKQIACLNVHTRVYYTDS